MAIVGVLLLAGCSATPATAPTGSVEPISSPLSSPPPTSSAGSTGAALAPDTCENILTPTALKNLTTAPNQFFPEFTDEMRKPGSQLSRFFELGGIACEWGHPTSDVAYVFATSPITDAQAAVEKAALTRLGWIPSRTSSGEERFTSDAEDMYRPVYEFGRGRWRYALLETDLTAFR